MQRYVSDTEIGFVCPFSMTQLTSYLVYFVTTTPLAAISTAPICKNSTTILRSFPQRALHSRTTMQAYNSRSKVARPLSQRPPPPASRVAARLLLARRRLDAIQCRKSSSIAVSHDLFDDLFWLADGFDVIQCGINPFLSLSNNLFVDLLAILFVSESQ